MGWAGCSRCSKPTNAVLAVLGAADGDAAQVFIELGTVVLGLAVLARVSGRFGVSPIPAYLLTGLAVGEGGLFELDVTEDFIDLGAGIGVVLLLLALGLEYSSDDLRDGLLRGVPVGAVNLAANFTPGLIAGYLLGWSGSAALVLGGVTYVTSSGVVSKVITDLDRLGNRETPTILALLVVEDLTMAVYLPVLAVVLSGAGVAAGLVSVGVALATVAAILAVALFRGELVTRLLGSRSDEVLLLSLLGLTLLVAGLAEQVKVSAAIGAFLVGIAVSGPVGQRANRLVEPLRDLFAAVFFLFFALRIDPADLPEALVVAAPLAVVTGGTKFAVGWWAARRAGVGPAGRKRAGSTLVARGEFSIVIAGLGTAAGVESDLGAVAAAYVLVLAVAGPVLARAEWARPRRPAEAM